MINQRKGKLFERLLCNVKPAHCILLLGDFPPHLHRTVMATRGQSSTESSRIS